MQPVEIRQRQERVAPKHFQPAAGVARAVAQDRAAHAVRDARLQFLETAGAPSDALTGDETRGRALVQRREQRRNERGIVLSVAVERRDNRRARSRNAAAHRRRLAARGLVPDLPQPWALRLECVHRGFGRVGRAVVDVDQLEDPAPVQHASDLIGERTDILGLIAHRNHHRNGGRVRGLGRCCLACWSVRLRRVSYRPRSLAATALRRRHDGPGIACTTPSAPGTKASRRAANQLRTRIAPKPPTNAAAITSLT